MLTLNGSQYIAGVASVASKLAVTIFGMERASADTYKGLYNGFLPNAAASLYTPNTSGATTAFISAISVVNTDSSTRTFTLYFNATSGSGQMTATISLAAGYMAWWDTGGWKVLDTSGVLQTVAGGGGGGSTSFGTPALTLSTSNSGGAASTAIRTDATIAVFDATNPVTQAFGDGAAPGSAGVAARRDHKHGMPTAELAATVAFSGAPDTSTATGNITALAVTNAVWRWNGASGANLCGVAGGTEGRLIVIENVTSNQTLVLKNQSSTESTAANRITTPDAADTNIAPGEICVLKYGATNSVWRVLGPDSTYSSNAANVGTAAAGTAGAKPARGDHVHATGASTPTTSAVGDAAATGSGPAAAMTDHKHGREAFGSSAAAVGTSSAGSAVTPSRSDHVHATGAGTPTTQAFGDGAATGSGPAAAMTDHKHAMPAASVGSSGLTVSATARILGRNSAGSGAVEELTATTTKSLLAIAQADVTGLHTGDSPTFTGLTLSGGALDISGASSGQIVFPAAQNASAGANTFDDYEEGTWTPTVTFATAGNLNVVYTTQGGWYTKVGRLVTVHLFVQTSTFTFTTASGNFTVGSLPFTTASSGSNWASGDTSIEGWTLASVSNLALVAVSNTTTFVVQASRTAAVRTNLTASQFTTGTNVIISGTATYFV